MSSTNEMNGEGRDLIANPSALQHPAVLRAAGQSWGSPDGSSNSAPENTGDLSQYLHSFRRHWLLALVLALPLGAAGTAAAWFFMPRVYTATAILRVSATDSPLVFETADNKSSGAPAGAFDVYKRTQRQWMRSRFVLLRALRDEPALANLPFLQDEADPADWLETNLNVTFPDESEVMHVSLSEKNPAGLDKLVNRVVAGLFRRNRPGRAASASSSVSIVWNWPTKRRKPS